MMQSAVDDRFCAPAWHPYVPGMHAADAAAREKVMAPDVQQGSKVLSA
jgi:hypothetical protein